MNITTFRDFKHQKSEIRDLGFSVKIGKLQLMIVLWTWMLITLRWYHNVSLNGFVLRFVPLSYQIARHTAECAHLMSFFGGKPCMFRELVSRFVNRLG